MNDGTRHAMVWGAWILTSLMMGCEVGGRQQVSTSEDMSARLAISNISDNMGNPEKFRALFVEGSAPDEATRKRFEAYEFSAVKVSVTDNNTATAQMELTDNATAEILDPIEWTLEKVGGVWKIKTSPLPP